MLTRESIERMGSPLARQLELHAEIGSTQERARELARAGAPHGTLVISRIQTGGRGRHSRIWASPLGGLWMSVVIRSELGVRHASRITQAAAVGVAKALRSLEVPASIKWPNDLLVEGRKVCGILAASSPHTAVPGGPVSATDVVILGVGLNANLDPQDLGASDNEVATIRTELGRDVEENLLLKTLLSHLEFELGRLKDFDGILVDWRKLNCTLGERVRVRKSGKTLEGVAVDLSPEGALILSTGKQILELFEGDVEHVRL